MHNDILERRFIDYIGGLPQNIDVETRNVLIGLKNYLYPSEGLSPLTYKDVMSLAIACAPQTEWDLWDTIRYANPHLIPQNNAMLDNIVNGVFNYYKKYRASSLVYHTPNETERACLEDLISTVRAIGDGSNRDIKVLNTHITSWEQMLSKEPTDPILKNALVNNIEGAKDRFMPVLTNEVYLVGKRHYVFPEFHRKIDFTSKFHRPEKMTEEEFKAAAKQTQNQLRDFFAMVYSVMLGQTDGPRLPHFVALMGADKFADKLESML
jgi:lysyl-tRNA synthetase class I